MNGRQRGMVEELSSVLLERDAILMKRGNFVRGTGRRQSRFLLANLRAVYEDVDIANGLFVPAKDMSNGRFIKMNIEASSPIVNRRT